MLSMKETPFTLEGSHRHAQARAVDIGSGLVPRALGVRRATTSKCRASEQVAHLLAAGFERRCLRMERRLRQVRVRQVAALRHHLAD